MPEVQRPEVQKPKANKPEVQVPKISKEVQALKQSADAQNILRDEMEKVEELIKEIDGIGAESVVEKKVDTKKTWG